MALEKDITVLCVRAGEIARFHHRDLVTRHAWVFCANESTTTTPTYQRHRYLCYVPSLPSHSNKKRQSEAMKRLTRYAEARAPEARVGNALEVCLLCRARSLAALVSLLPQAPSVRSRAREIEKLWRLPLGALLCAKPLEKARLAALKAHLDAIFPTLSPPTNARERLSSQ